ncbi:MAG: BlaI/MecI/CopY family transcriptional regulator [Clostridia bacterium]|nr:BlaI/MecI/CopY family transcriptional regulator [Clostridia bacterium]
MDDGIKFQSFSLEREGLARVLGSLEAEVMEIIWRKGQEVTIREVWEELMLARTIAFNTVMTVMNRLADKKLLRREPGREAYRFLPVQTREGFLREISRRVAAGLVEDFGEHAIAPFVEALDVAGPGYLEELEEFIRRRKERRDKHR